jgi:putative ABC transport system substrate-binding protein
MRRREFVTLLGVAAAWPLAARAQQGRIFRIGFVTWQSQVSENQLVYLREGLAQYGYVEGRNISLAAHFTDGNRERTQAVKA